MLAIELGDMVPLKQIEHALVESLAWIEGVGKVEVTYMGVLEQEGGE